nr:hypothetical protein BaRGS_003026 [Batillaria attramentaria]
MKKSPSDLESQDVDNDDVYNSEDLYASYKTVGAIQQLDAFQRYLITCLGSGQLAAQFQVHVGMTEENKRKNRFKALCTYDHNRVIMQKPGEDSSDYINATYIKDKCEEYWPASGKSQTYGHVTVRGLEEQQRADFVIRSFVLKATGAQYKFLHEVILEAHTSRDTRVSVGQFDVTFPDTIQVNRDNKRIDKEFQMLNVMGQFSGKPSTTMATENLDKNRNMDALPDDGDLAYLSVYVRGRTQYINAVYLPSFHHRHGFILTQMPIPNNTLIDFWRLVDGCHVTKIVSLGSEEETETVKFWPHATGEVLNTGPYSIITNGSTRLGAFLNTYRLTVKRKTDGESRNVEVYHYRNWEHEVPSDTSSLLQLVDTVKCDNPNDFATPIIIQCIDGVAKSGLFAVLCDVISRVTHDDEVDVYLNAREVQRIRPQAVATKLQYRYLYKAAQDYIGNLGVAPSA